MFLLRTSLKEDIYLWQVGISCVDEEKLVNRLLFIFCGSSLLWILSPSLKWVSWVQPFYAKDVSVRWRRKLIAVGNVLSPSIFYWQFNTLSLIHI